MAVPSGKIFTPGTKGRYLLYLVGMYGVHRVLAFNAFQIMIDESSTGRWRGGKVGMSWIEA